ncbi:hypothetical protein PE36_00060 [Moritella sp. PE36]|uniref:phage tail tube protein n=1 Tax=Moritella sp. PE36 TaxID=58051 RepID=UPI0001569148|nr:hypothetical protein [Moritella sp. PE36]EDM66143.1 hypothetical protein PE36_00060 [Moritella sp. PE36]
MAGLTDISVGNFTKVYYESATPGTFVEIANIQSITHPTDELNIVEVPQFGQKYPRKLPGSSTTGNAEIVVNFDPADASHIYLLASYKAGDKESFKIEILEAAGSAVGTFITWNGFVSSRSSAGEFDAVTTLTFSLAVDDALGDWEDNPT